jgi:asparagine synthase (glutamine-hydrolysing)
MTSSDSAEILALLWRPGCRSSADEALALSRRLQTELPQLRLAMSGPGLMVHARPGGIGTVNLKSPAHAMIGELFGGSRDGPLPGEHWPDRLVADHWGRYVVFAAGSETTLPGFMRDPSGMLELFAFPIGQLLLVVDRLPERLAAALDIGPTIDWDALAAIATHTLRASFEAPLKSLTIAVPGCWYEWDGKDLTHRTCWSPVSFAAQACNSDAPAALYDAVRDSVSDLLSGHDAIAIELSGGLDSSILAGMLADSVGTPALHALNLAPQSPGGDERNYARATAAHAGARLSEVLMVPPALDYLAHRQQPRTLLPAIYGLDILADTVSAGHADAVGATRIVSGQGGDAIFFQPRANAVLGDHLRLHGLDRRFFSLAMDIAFRRHVSIWSVIRDAVRPAAEDDVRIGSAIAEIAGPRTRAALQRPRRRHPWIEQSGHLLPAKAMQVGLIANCQVFSHPTQTSAGGRLVQPFLTQPVIEAALAVSVPELTPDRRDRGLARDLFKHELAPEIWARRTKGEASGFYSRALAAHLETLTPLLLDGRLTQHGIVSRAGLEALLRYDVLMTRDVSGLLGWLVSLELWAERWN